MIKPEDIGRLVRQTRIGLGLTQENLSLATGTGRRFIIDLEKGKPTCQLGSVLAVLHALGIQMDLSTPDPISDQPPGDRQAK